VLALSLAVLLVAFRRVELERLEGTLRERREAQRKGTHQARLQYPHVDLSRCLGCGACVRACPEDGVLALIHGQAMVVHGARCVGHGVCAQECPTGAIALTIGDLETRRDIPALSPELESPQVPGLFLGGELTGFALIRTAIEHGTAVVNEVARRVAAGERSEGAFDLLVVGAGPGGLAASLQARAHGLWFLTIEQDTLGGTVSKYPRRKLVMTQPVELPLHGSLDRDSYQKEELIELWTEVAQAHQLPIHTGVRFVGLRRQANGILEVATDRGTIRARHVLLALGRRGTPRQLGVPGEDLPKVAYSLIDAQSYTSRRILVVGGGDSAIEAALALSEQEGNEITLSYRKGDFSRIKQRNQQRLDEALAQQRLRVIFHSQVRRIEEQSVELCIEGGPGAGSFRLPNDEVFVFAGGIPPFELLESCGVSFDPADRPSAPAPVERGTGLLKALGVALALALTVLTWVTWNADYYTLPAALRPDSPLHERLRPAGPIGLALGFLATGCLFVNLAYLLRRHNLLGVRRGSLRAWMSLHVGTGVLALLLALVHGAMGPQDTIGRRTLLALSVVVVTGAIGRYLYSFVPRAANGRELKLDELWARMAAQSAEWDRENREFGQLVRDEVEGLLNRPGWSGGWLRRVGSMVLAPRELRSKLKALRHKGQEAGLADDQLERLLTLARRAHRTALMATHYEDLRGVVGSWRYLHRWIALLMMLLLLLHVLVAIRYGQIFA